MNAPHCREKKRFQEIDEIWKSYNIDRSDIENVKIDLELLKKGWNINFAIDFYQIFNFLYPERKRKASINSYEHEIELRAAGAFIFSELEEVRQPFLLPPYLIELTNHLAYLKDKITKAKEERHYEDLLEESDLQKLEKAKKIYKRKKELPKKLMNEVIDLINAKFPTLFKLISGGFKNEIAEINRLFRNKRISVVTEYWEGEKDILNLIQKENEKSVAHSGWYNGFQKLKPLENIARNVRDARAIQIVMALNNFFKENDRKKVIYLVSDAEAMENVLNWDKNDDINWKIEEHPLGIIKNLGKFKNVRILRNSRSFLIYLLNRGKSENNRQRWIETIQNLNAQQDKLDRLSKIRGMINNLFEECKEKCNDPEREEQCQKIQKKIEEYERVSKETNLFKLISQSKRFLGPYINQFMKVTNQEKETEDIRSMIEFLMLEKEDFERKIEQKTEELDANINQILSKLQSDIVRALPFDSFKKMTYKLRRLRGIPYKIIFRNEVIKEALNDFFGLIDEFSEESELEIGEGRFEDIQREWEGILKLTEDESLGLESRLLLSVILFSYKFYQEIISIKSEIESEFTKAPEIEKEFLLLECLANYRLYRNKGVQRYFEITMNTCAACVGKYYGDPRFLNLSAILKAISDQSKGSIQNSLSLLDEARKISQTDPSWDDPHIKSTILNNIVFINLIQKDLTMKAIEETEGLMEEIADLHPHTKWDADMMHTEGLLFLEKAVLVRSSKKKKEILKKSIKKFEKAKEMAYEFDLDRYRKENIRNDLKRARTQLNALDS
ncbi:MAG: hypothetical protein PVF58_00445 [Candidatus Methanofastidiosia archaeon]|jgi:hypothetical protein